jgi:hypothetical protein
VLVVEVLELMVLVELAVAAMEALARTLVKVAQETLAAVVVVVSMMEAFTLVALVVQVLSYFATHQVFQSLLELV